MAEFRDTSGPPQDRPQSHAERLTAFGHCRFNPRTGQLWRGRREVKLTPRAASVLAILVEQAGQIVTKQVLNETVWGGIAVGDDAITSCIQELRQALGDNARKPLYIETRHRRGYRLITPATVALQSSPLPPRQHLVGREEPLSELARRFECAAEGQRQLVLVSGEPGIGKSALVDFFLAGLATDRGIRIARGQCLDHHGAGEPYLPMIDALTRMAGAPDGADLRKLLAEQAPGWLAQMPSLWTRAQRIAFGARGLPTRERLLSELTLTIEAICKRAPLVVHIEDIHWSDVSTLTWLTHVIRRLEPARLLILATIRPADRFGLRGGLDRLVGELGLHGQYHEVSLSPLSVSAIERYLKDRLGERAFGGRLREVAERLLTRTGGNPLFLAGIVDRLGQAEAPPDLAEAMATIPTGVRRYIEHQIEELEDTDRELLMAGSVVRREFASAAVAAALDTEVRPVEEALGRLCRSGIIGLSGTTSWPDGTRTDLFSFQHDLYRELLYERLSPSGRIAAHARIGTRLERAWASQPEAVAAELADHFERGDEPVRAIPHFHRAAEKALRGGANEEAIGHLQRALRSIDGIVDPQERDRAEVALQVARGAALMALQGFGAPEVADAYARAEFLCTKLDGRSDLFPSLWGQWLFRWGRSQLDEAEKIGERLLVLGTSSGEAGLELQAHHAMWATMFGRGNLARLRAHAEAGLLLYEPARHRSLASRYGNHDAFCCGHNFLAMSQALGGDVAGSRQSMGTALQAAQELDDPFTLALTHYFGSVTRQTLGDRESAAENAALSLKIATEHGFALPKVWSIGVLGWCSAANGDTKHGLALLDEAIEALRATQSRHFMHYLLALQADVLLRAGQPNLALATAGEGVALAKTSGESFYLAALYCLQAEAHRTMKRESKARPLLVRSIELARRQGAFAIEQKARGHLARA
jgi:DNA-binding winged helix-turn-helix (wHTH) protein/tetratricopeptide (TPR) repeat protein